MASRVHPEVIRPTSKGQLRRVVLLWDRGRCVNCGAGPFYADQSIWVWHAHHVIEQQTLRNRGHRDLALDPRGVVVLCRRCHEKHTNAFERVDGAKLPRRCYRFAHELGPWAEDLLVKYHPTKGAP